MWNKFFTTIIHNKIINWESEYHSESFPHSSEHYPGGCPHFSQKIIFFSFPHWSKHPPGDYPHSLQKKASTSLHFGQSYVSKYVNFSLNFSIHRLILMWKSATVIRRSSSDSFFSFFYSLIISSFSNFNFFSDYFFSFFNFLIFSSFSNFNFFYLAWRS